MGNGFKKLSSNAGKLLSTATFYECHTIGVACFNHEIYNQIPPWLMVNDGIPDRYFCNFYCNNDVFKLYKSEA